MVSGLRVEGFGFGFRVEGLELKVYSVGAGQSRKGPHGGALQGYLAHKKHPPP